jgi:uncharacterized low-complexity protein
MNSNSPKKPVALAIGAALATSLAATSVAQAANPFSLTALSSAYMAAGEGNCGADHKKASEGKCGGEKKEAAGDKSKAEGEMKCGEGKCGASNDKDKDKAKEGTSGEEKKS